MTVKERLIKKIEKIPEFSPVDVLEVNSEQRTHIHFLLCLNSSLVWIVTTCLVLILWLVELKSKFQASTMEHPESDLLDFLDDVDAIGKEVPSEEWEKLPNALSKEFRLLSIWVAQS